MKFGFSGIDNGTITVSELSGGAFDLNYDYHGNLDTVVHDGHFMWELVKSGRLDISAFDLNNKDDLIFGKIVTRLAGLLDLPTASPELFEKEYDRRKANFSTGLLALGARVYYSIGTAMASKSQIQIRKGS